jgi:hypothetical protein
MWALKVPNLRYRHKQNRCNICSHSLPQEIYATSTTLICISRIVTPRALCGRGAIDVKPLRGFSAVLQAIKHPDITPSHHHTHTRNHANPITQGIMPTQSHKESCQPSHTRNHANPVTQGIMPTQPHRESRRRRHTRNHANPVTQSITSKTSHKESCQPSHTEYHVEDVTQGIMPTQPHRESRRRRHISLAPRPPQRRTWGTRSKCEDTTSEMLHKSQISDTIVAEWWFCQFLIFNS